jgi:hypothetical protein
MSKALKPYTLVGFEPIIFYSDTIPLSHADRAVFNFIKHTKSIHLKPQTTASALQCRNTYIKPYTMAELEPTIFN